MAAAVVWAFSVILFKKSGESVHPLALNTFKSTLATALLIPTLLVGGETLYYSAPAQDYGLLLFSGVIGITLADTLFFKSLNLLGAGLSAIVDCLYSPFVILLSVLFIGEQLGGLQVIGVFLIISAVLTVTSRKGNGMIKRQDLVWGSIWGALAMAMMAVSIVMIKPLLDRSPLLWATEIRLISGSIGLYVLLLCHERKKAILETLFIAGTWKYTLAGSFLGGYVAMIAWIGGMKYTQASIASALNQSSNVFVFLFAAFFLKERITVLRLAAIITAIIGVFLVAFG